MDFGDIQDKQMQEKLKSFHDVIDKLEDFLSGALNPKMYETLSTKEKVDYDLFLAYSLNTLYWMYLRSRGEDPNQNDVKNQLNRLKDYMLQAKKANDRNTIRPRLNQDVAGRFIKHGISHKEDKANEPPNKRIKFDH